MHKSLQALLLLTLAAALAGCSTNAPDDQPRQKPTALVNVDAFAAEYRSAVQSVAALLARNGEPAEDFYAEVEPTQNGQIIILHLWHESAFEPQNSGVAGNPGGKCRDVHYDVRLRKAIQTVFWQ